MKDAQIGDWRVLPEKSIIEKNNSEIKVKSLCMKILWCLIEHDGNIVSKDALITECWDGRIVSDDAVRQAIKELRDYLGCNGYESRYIETVRKQGYRLIITDSNKSSNTNIDNNSDPVHHKDPVLEPINNLKNNYFKRSVIYLALLASGFTSYVFYKQNYPTHSLDNKITTLTYDKDREIDYEQNSYNWDAYVKLFPGKTSGEKIVIRDHKKKIVHQIHSTSPDGYVFNPAFSPNGNKLAYLDYGNNNCLISIIDVKSGKAIQSINCHNSDKRIALDWISDNEILYSTSTSSKLPLTLRQYNLDTGEQYSLTSPAIGGRGDYFARACGDKALVLRNINWTSTSLYTIDLKTKKEVLVKKFNETLNAADWIGNCNEILYFLENKGLYSISPKDRKTKLISDNLNKVKTFVIKDKKLIYSEGDYFNQEIISISEGKKIEMKIIVSSIGSNSNFIKANNEDYAFISNRTGLPQLWLNKNGNNVQISNFVDYSKISTIEWSKDNKSIYVARDNQVLKFNTESLKSTIVFSCISQIQSFVLTSDSSILYSVYKNEMWQGYRFNEQEDFNAPINNLAVYEFRKNSNGDIYFILQDNSIYKYNTNNNTSEYNASVDKSQTDWLIDNNYLYYIANDKLIEKDLNTNNNRVIIDNKDLGVKFTLTKENVFYIGQTKSGSIDVKERYINQVR